MHYPNRLSLPGFFVIFFALLLGAAPSLAQNTRLSASVEAAAIADLESGDVNRIMQTLEVLPDPYNHSLYRNQTSYSMALALIEASQREIDWFFNFDERNDDDNIDHEFASRLKDYIIPLRIPEAIPALLKATQFGNPAAYALADFGPDIVYTIIEYLDDPQRTPNEIGGAFLALMRTIETHHPLSLSIRSAAKKITVRYLKRAEEFYTGPDGSISGILYTISVAKTLGDSDLKEMVINIIPIEDKIIIHDNGMSPNWAQYTIDTWDVVQQDQLHQND